MVLVMSEPEEVPLWPLLEEQMEVNNILASSLACLFPSPVLRGLLSASGGVEGTGFSCVPLDSSCRGAGRFLAMHCSAPAPCAAAVLALLPCSCKNVTAGRANS